MKKVQILFLFLFSVLAKAQDIDPLRSIDFQKQQQWVDSIYNQMNIDQKIGQLFMVQAFSSKKLQNQEAVKKLIKKYEIGGIIFSKGTPFEQIKLNNDFQSISKVPLLIAMDAEWGLAMRLDSTYAYPWNMTLGAIKNQNIIEKTAQQIAQHCKRMGVHLNFAPDIDINTNAQNPIIGNRSFGQSKENVAEKGKSFVKGFHQEGILSCAKHFPGHGDTSKDSHLELPTINFSKERFEEIEFYPFKSLIEAGVTTVMIGHLNVPRLDSSEKPSSLSYDIVTKILKEKMNFKGLIFTDALSMKGVANYAKDGQVELLAFLAGNDMLLMPENLPQAITKIKQAYVEGKISEKRLSESVKKILKAKYWVGLHKKTIVRVENIHSDLSNQNDILLTETLFEKAITLVKNQNDLLPIKELGREKTAYLKMGSSSEEYFLKTLRFYENIYKIKEKKWDKISKEIEPFERIIIALHQSDKNPWADYKFKSDEIDLIEKISQYKSVILVIFTSPYALLDLPTLQNVNSIVVSYQNHKISQQKTAQIIYGAIASEGVLPVSAHKELPMGTGIFTIPLQRLQYGLPESVFLNSSILQKIDTIVLNAIAQKMTPSAQVLVAKEGKVVYNKSFGTYTYDDSKKVTENSLYDLASLTKILATLPKMMQLYEQGYFHLDTQLGEMLPKLKGSNKEKITVKEALSHNAQLQSWIPFYKKTFDGLGKLSSVYYSKEKTELFSEQVAPNLYLLKHYKDSIFEQIKNSDLLKKKGYLYSDLSFYLFQQYIENQLHKKLDKIIDSDFYKTIGAYNLTYNPLDKFDIQQIVPTEKDMYFRGQIIQGFVHDQGAAMLSGVAGHAGLFGNANDVAKIMQLYLQKGNYGGVNYFSSETFDVFNTVYYTKNRRALGFDKPQFQTESGPTCGCVSSLSFGHSGFTGTYAWADPQTQIIYVFLSNRTFPSSENKKLINKNIRTQIQEIIQSAIIK